VRIAPNSRWRTRHDRSHEDVVPGPAKAKDAVFTQRDQNFPAWWNAGGQTDGFNEADRRAYRALAERRRRQPAATTPLVRQLDEERYGMGSRVFEEWVAQR